MRYEDAVISLLAWISRVVALCVHQPMKRRYSKATNFRRDVERPESGLGAER